MVPKQCNSEKQKHRGKEKSYLEKLVNMVLNFLIKCPSALLLSYYSLHELHENKITIISQCVQHNFITKKPNLCFIIKKLCQYYDCSNVTFDLEFLLKSGAQGTIRAIAGLVAEVFSEAVSKHITISELLNASL